MTIHPHHLIVNVINANCWITHTHLLVILKVIQIIATDAYSLIW